MKKFHIFLLSLQTIDIKPLNYTQTMNLIFNNFFSTCDAPRAWGVYSADSPQMEELVELHDNIMFFLVIIFVGLGWILISIIRNYVYSNSKSPGSNYKNNENYTLIQLFLGVLGIILVILYFSTFHVLHLMDESQDPSLRALSYNSDHIPAYQDQHATDSSLAGSDDEILPYPLNVPEASDTDEIPREIITPDRSDSDPHLTLLRNEVRVAFNQSETVTNRWNNSPQDNRSVTLSDCETADKAFSQAQDELKRYLNNNYNGTFDLDQDQDNNN